MATDSDAFSPLAHIHLEDSWVLALSPSEDMLTFDLDAVLTEAHPEYRGPASGEQYDYRRARLTLRGQVSCVLSGLPPTTGPDGEEDLGNLGSWTVDAAGVSLLAGDWGEARVSDAQVTFVLT